MEYSPIQVYRVGSTNGVAWAELSLVATALVVVGILIGIFAVKMMSRVEIREVELPARPTFLGQENSLGTTTQVSSTSATQAPLPDGGLRKRGAARSNTASDGRPAGVAAASSTASDGPPAGVAAASSTASTASAGRPAGVAAASLTSSAGPLPGLWLQLLLLLALHPLPGLLRALCRLPANMLLCRLPPISLLPTSLPLVLLMMGEEFRLYSILGIQEGAFTPVCFTSQKLVKDFTIGTRATALERLGTSERSECAPPV